jgi:long-chain acyl-CoA synthetase
MDGFAMQQPNSLQEVIDGLAARGERTAVQAWHREGADEWSYQRLGDAVRRLAAGLHGRMEPAAKVALFAPDGPEWVVAALAAVRAGVVPVPIDLQAGDDTLAHILEDSGAVAVFTTGRHAEAVHRLAADVDVLRLDDGARQALEHDHPDRLPDLRADDVAVLFYTSGTTGSPKGVPLSHANLSFQLRPVREAGIVGADDRVLLPLPLHHVYAFVVGMLTPLALGLTLIMPHALTGQQLVRAARDGRATVMIGVPRLYDALLGGMESRAAQRGRLAQVAVRGALDVSRFSRRHLALPLGRWALGPLRRQLGPSLRVLASGGSPLDEALAWNLEALGWRVAVGYGLTETSPLISINSPGRGRGRMGSVGRAVADTEVRIDRSALEERGEAGGASPGRENEGEIQVRGPGVFRGYHGLEDETRKSFTGDGWFRTGDLGYLDDGWLYVSGRLSTLIVTESGENVQPDELEDRYARHPAIREIGVLQHQGRLVGLAVPADRQGDVRQRLREAVQEVARGLPSYQRLSDCLPSAEPLPRTRLGKIRRHELQQRFESARQQGAETPAAEPMRPAEMSADDQALLEDPAARATWDWLAERFPKSGLSPDSDPRLDLGVDSMEWLNLTLDLGERVGVELDEQAIARVESVRDLLQEAVDARSSAADGGPAHLLDDPERVLGERQRRWLEPRSPLLRAAAGALYGTDRSLIRRMFRLQVHGLEHVPGDGPFVLACNHASYLDPFLIAAALPRERLQTLYWGGWTGAAFANPLQRLVSRAAQVIPIDPEHGARSSLALAAAVLKEGHGLIWFPEGERSPTGELQPFRRGIGMILERFPVPVVPALIDGSFDAMPRGQRLPRRRPITLYLGEPADPRSLAEHGEGDGAPARIVHALQERVSALREQAPRHAGKQQRA